MRPLRPHPCYLTRSGSSTTTNFFPQTQSGTTSTQVHNFHPHPALLFTATSFGNPKSLDNGCALFSSSSFARLRRHCGDAASSFQSLLALPSHRQRAHLCSSVRCGAAATSLHLPQSPLAIPSYQTSGAHFSSPSSARWSQIRSQGSNRCEDQIDRKFRPQEVQTAQSKIRSLDTLISFY